MDSLIRRNVMTRYLKREELENIEGGNSLTGTLINAFTDAVKTLFNIGRSLGSSIRRIKEKHICKV